MYFWLDQAVLGKQLLLHGFLKAISRKFSAYVNCWKYRSTHDVLSEILRGFGFVIHGREYTSELITKLEDLLKKRKIIICLDEVDQLKEFDVLYT